MRPLPEVDLAHVLAHTSELWAESAGASFFISGGTGFFGIWLLESLLYVNQRLGLGMRATVLTRDPAAFLQKVPHFAGVPELTLLRGDIGDFAFPPGPFTYGIHAATDVSGALGREAPWEMLETIVGGTRRVLDFATCVGMKKLLFTSSGAVYGRQPAEVERVSEEYSGAPDPLLPGSAYGEGKRMAEHLCVVDALRHSYEVKIARCFAFVGPHLPMGGNFAIGNFIRDALRGGPVEITGDVRTERSYLYASELAIWLWTLLFKGRSGRAYNVGSSEAFTLGEIAGLVGAAIGGNPRVSFPAAGAGVAFSRYIPCTKRAETELGLRRHIGLLEGIQKTAAWLTSG
jgi:nucleoside-diphosphate-sugar epimerase